jgi:hypothetical protein
LTTAAATCAPAEKATSAPLPNAAATRACCVPAPAGVTGTEPARNCSESTNGAASTAEGTWNASSKNTSAPKRSAHASSCHDATDAT